MTAAHTEIQRIETRMAELARQRAESMRAIEAHTEGLRGFVLSLFASTQERVEWHILMAEQCRTQFEALREEREQLLAQADPDKAETIARVREHQILMEKAARLRREGGPRVELLNRLERERRIRMCMIEECSRTVYLGQRALDALDLYAMRLTVQPADAASLRTLSLTGRVSASASLNTVAAEAHETVRNFVNRLHERNRPGIGFGGEATPAEIARVAALRRDLQACLAHAEKALDTAKSAMRPIEAAYRSLLGTVGRAAA